MTDSDSLQRRLTIAMVTLRLQLLRIQHEMSLSQQQFDGLLTEYTNETQKLGLSLVMLRLERRGHRHDANLIYQRLHGSVPPPHSSVDVRLAKGIILRLGQATQLAKHNYELWERQHEILRRSLAARIVLKSIHQYTERQRRAGRLSDF